MLLIRIKTAALLFAALPFAVRDASAQACAGAGNGASGSVAQSFINACNRGTFPLVTPTALGSVRTLSGASPALVQEFGPAGAAGQSAVKAALIKPDPNFPVTASDTLQVFSDIYAVYQSVGATTAGLPGTDTLACPTNSFGNCTYQIFSKNYAIIAYASQAVTVADPFYTKWVAAGGIAGPLGPATASGTTVTSPAQTSGSQQTFAGGEIFSYASGGTTVTYSVSGPVFLAYSSGGDYLLAGFPTSDEVILPSGLHRQTFQAARVEWTPGQASATILFPLANLDILGAAQGLTINAGATATLTATALDTHNNIVKDRVFTWSTANGSVAAVTGNTITATVRGLSSGTTNIYVSAEGKTSPPFPVTVKGICCAIGEGAPTQAVTQAFQAAAARNNLSVTLPAAAGVVRAGSGYVQTLTAADGSGTVYAIAQSDKSAVAYVISGPLYKAYLALGGFGGSLGYPASDVLAGGAQTFESGGALAGNPARLIPAAVAKRWLSAGGPNGALGNPAGDGTDFVSFSGATGIFQLFAGGTIYAITNGPGTGQAFVSGGLILARYIALSGPLGALGAPTSDPVSAGSVQSQNFEGGYIDLQAGATAAVEHFNPRHPTVSVQPATVAPGGRVRITVSGFTPGAGISISVTGQPAFTVAPISGSFAWDAVIASNAKPATVLVTAKAATGADTASAAYAISSALSLLPRWTLISGDRQNGLPGAALPVPLTALLADVDGTPIPNIPVTISVSPGAIAQSAGVTGPDGRIAVTVRVPNASGVVVLSLTAAGQVITFSALAAPSILSGFPAFNPPDNTLLGPGPATFAQQGSLLYTLAALIRYQQNAGALPAPNGLATPAALNQYLNAKAGYVLSERGSPVANPWIAAQFAGSNASVGVAKPSTEQIRDILQAGVPAGVVLTLSIDGAPAGSTTVSAIGVASDGGILISDPNPAYARSALNDYLGGFTVPGHSITATIASLIRVTATSSPGGFVAGATLTAGASVRSGAGVCSAGIDLADPAPAASLGGVRFVACDETAAPYEIVFETNTGATVVDLRGGAPQLIPKGPILDWKIYRNGEILSVAPQSIGINSVVDAAVYGDGLSPGGLVSIFGTGFQAEPGKSPAVKVDGQPMSLLATLPFQINAQLPPSVTVGPAEIQVSNSLGAAKFDVVINTVSPQIFIIGSAAGGRGRGAIVNQNTVINSTAFPASRGDIISIYCTGLGATTGRSGFEVAVAPVTVLVNGISLVPDYAGLAPGFIGLYQINVQIPNSAYPGLTSLVQIQQGSSSSNIVAFALQ